MTESTVTEAESSESSESSAAPPRRGRVRTGVSWAVTVLAFLVVWFALVVPNRVDQWPAALLRLPVEGIALVALCLCLPRRARRVVAVTAGVLLGLLTFVELLDMPFNAALDRPFGLVTDWSNLKPAISFLRGVVGEGNVLAAASVLLLVLLAVLVVLPLALLRITRLAAGRRPAAVRVVAVLGAVWIMCAVLDVRPGDGEPVASRSAATIAYGHAGAAYADVRDPQVFGSVLESSDPPARTPRTELLSALRGKDVLVVFVESYGENAIRGSSYSPGVRSVLESGTRDLRSAGYSTRSAMLTSPTFGGVSWLAHGTLQSGLWVDSPQRYDQLLGSDRFTLSRAFKDAGWRTVSVQPANNRPWPQGQAYYGYDEVYDSRNVGYEGPKFGYAPVPDQYTLAAFGREELAARDRAPVMAEIDLVSSHAPWTSVPRVVAWDDVGDGSVYDEMPHGQSAGDVWRDPRNVRSTYGESIQYSLRSLFSFVRNEGDDDLVVVALGDHQPGTTVTGPDASHRVPVSVIAKDPKVTDRISSWGWQDGMLPGQDAPVWRMDAFRDRFLTAYRG